MMKHEFDNLVGLTTDPECYKKIEAVYMQFDEMFPTKESVAAFYKKHDMNGFERMYREALKIQKLEDELKDYKSRVDDHRVVHSTVQFLNNLVSQACQFRNELNFSLMDDEEVEEVLSGLNDWDVYGEIRVDDYAYNWDSLEEGYVKRNVKTRETYDGVFSPRHVYRERILGQTSVGQTCFEMLLDVEDERGSSTLVPLGECPVGLFRYDGVLVLKTEYVDGSGRCECYLTDSGERFWGDHSLNLNSLLVEPVHVKEAE